MMSVGDKSFELWRQMEDLKEGVAQADLAKGADRTRFQSDIVKLLNSWQSRLCEIAIEAGDTSEVTRRLWSFPDKLPNQE
jgi:hypothetical protein